MTKAELVTRAAATAGMRRKDVERAWEAIQAQIAEGLKAEQAVTLDGVGKLTPIQRAARKARNPQTGSKMDVPAKRSVKLKVSSKFVAL